MEMHRTLLGTDTIYNVFPVELTGVFVALNAEMLSDAESLPPVADFPVCRATRMHFSLVKTFVLCVLV